jgi:hypothetical protein
MKHIVEVDYVKEDQTRATMHYTTSCPKAAKDFAAYYRKKLKSGGAYKAVRTATHK